MIVYAVRRMLVAVPVLFGVAVISFLLVHAAAGSFVPGLEEARPDLTPQDVERIRHVMGVDQPLYFQFTQWLSEVLRGNLGVSLIDGQPVITTILDRLPNTLVLS